MERGRRGCVEKCDLDFPFRCGEEMLEGLMHLPVVWRRDQGWQGWKGETGQEATTIITARLARGRWSRWGKVRDGRTCELG